jgi:hypothetical protein
MEVFMDIQSQCRRDRIRKTSRLFVYFLFALMIIVPLIDCLVWYFINEFPNSMQHEILPAFARLPLSPLARFLGWCTSLLPLGLFLYAILTLIKLFKFYENGKIFTGDNVKCFSKLSKIVMSLSLVQVLVDPLQSVALTLQHPEGERILAIGLSSVDISIFSLGGVLAVISWVMDEARLISEEQELTI